MRKWNGMNFTKAEVVVILHSELRVANLRMFSAIAQKIDKVEFLHLSAGQSHLSSPHFTQWR